MKREFEINNNGSMFEFPKVRDEITEFLRNLWEAIRNTNVKKIKITIETE